MQRLAVLALLVLTVLPARGAVCDLLGAAGQFRFVANQSLIVKLENARDALEPVGFYGNVCTTSARLAGIEHQSLGSSEPANFVATRGSGNAILMKTLPEEYFYDHNLIDGSIVTGGGAVAGTDFTLAPDGVVDTSGTHPLVGTCTQAMADARAASAALAALPPTMNLGAVRVRVGETLQIDARGGAVIAMDTLQLDRPRGKCPIPNTCDCFEDAAFLDIAADPGDEVIINVRGTLAVGSSSTISTPASSTVKVVFNLPGKGSRVSFGYEAFMFGASVLAPDRALDVRGGGDDTITAFGTNLWVRRAKLTGFAYLDETGFQPGACP